MTESAKTPAKSGRRVRELAGEPVKAAGKLDNMRSFFNFADEASFVAVVDWLEASLRPRSAYSILFIQGDQGSGKSTLTRQLCSLVDIDNTRRIRGMPRNERALAAIARDSQVVAIDNVSIISGKMSAAICQLLVEHPVILNGIPDLTTHFELERRAHVVRLLPLDEILSNDEVENDWESVRRAILGALCDGLVSAF